MLRLPAAQDGRRASSESYVPEDGRETAQDRLREVLQLEDLVRHCPVGDSRRHVVEDYLDDTYGTRDCGGWVGSYLAYMSQHPEDLPHDPEYEARRDQFDRDRLYVKADQDARQNEVFGRWTWPTKATTRADWPLVVGPKNEVVEQKADLPAMCGTYNDGYYPFPSTSPLLSALIGRCTSTIASFATARLFHSVSLYCLTL